uniref:Uncharacterized protein n=1 Tax=Brassica oleracea TaxID=3712 RepID=A0A3P6ACF5_BRAOL|nr:unnamed protein product [Brassica oleracea]
MGALDISLSQSFLFFSRRSYPPSSTHTAALSPWKASHGACLHPCVQ